MVRRENKVIKMKEWMDMPLWAKLAIASLVISGITAAITMFSSWNYILNNSTMAFVVTVVLVALALGIGYSFCKNNL